MTLLKFINMFILQLFFIRLEMVYKDDMTFKKFRIMKWVYPFTGWNKSRPYKFLKTGGTNHG